MLIDKADSPMFVDYWIRALSQKFTHLKNFYTYNTV